MQAIITEYETGWLINNRNVFLTVLEAGQSRIKVSGEGHFSGDSRLLGPQRVSELPGVSSARAPMPFTKAPPPSGPTS